MTRIAFVDNQRTDLAPLRALLIEENHIVESYGDGQFALEAFQRRMPDLVMINLPTSKIESATLIDRIRTNSIVPIMLVSVARDEIDEIMGLRFGADDYIHMPVSPRLLSERIKALLRRHAMLLAHARTPAAQDKVLVCGDLTIDPSQHDVFLKDCQVNLTMTEFQLLQALVRRPGIVKSREQLMSVSCADETYVGERTVDSHIKRIRKKLREIDPKFSSIQTLYGIGYRYVPAAVRQTSVAGPLAALPGPNHDEQASQAGAAHQCAVPWYNVIPVSAPRRPATNYPAPTPKAVRDHAIAATTGIVGV